MPTITFDYDFNDINLTNGEEVEIYANDKNENRIGFIKIHITENNKIVILADGQFYTMENIVFDQWQGSSEYQKKINQIENED